jgi:hypothetical protein
MAKIDTVKRLITPKKWGGRASFKCLQHHCAVAYLIAMQSITKAMQSITK